jgi:hypothetical protein
VTTGARLEALERRVAVLGRLVTVPWGAAARGRDRILRTFERYWERLRRSRRYYANEDIRVEGDEATAFARTSGRSVARARRGPRRRSGSPFWS